MVENKTQAWSRLRNLVWALSPENLSCDGELSASQIRLRRSALKRDWAACEALIGHPVSEAQIDSHFRK